ncbi:helix-turn-helix domain-containing protein [Terrisporobacter muris]|uniref:Helix-turn-helix transcriptional regulator n=1 Tax=Terrisporobacter muris TaxID=2963284 RepID=A0A9X2S0X9_9FIRM|nr:helix-turn-helix transcriptional regulator [Terrisporobacter muris]MCR1822433.1 helix-turn-helix transcriptional regulator [Terrisporobacter muris]
MEISDKINQILKERNISANKLAKEADIPVSNIYKIIQDKNLNPGVYTVKAIADYLGITIDELIENKAK